VLPGGQCGAATVASYGGRSCVNKAIYVLLQRATAPEKPPTVGWKPHSVCQKGGCQVELTDK
jgi:hypothetical protein